MLGNIRKKFKSQEWCRRYERFSLTSLFDCFVVLVCGHVPHMATQKWTSNNREKSIVHFAGRLIGISAQSDRLLDLAIDRYNTNPYTMSRELNLEEKN